MDRTPVIGFGNRDRAADGAASNDVNPLRSTLVLYGTKDFILCAMNA